MTLLHLTNLHITKDGRAYHEIKVMGDWVMVSRGEEHIEVISPSKTFVTSATSEGVLEAFTEAAEQLGIDDEYLKGE